MFAFVFLMPGLQSTLFCLAIGRDPTGLKMAVVNEELDPSVGRVCNYTTDCTYSMFSCRYLRFLDNTTIVQVNLFRLTINPNRDWCNINRLCLLHYSDPVSKSVGCTGCNVTRDSVGSYSFRSQFHRGAAGTAN
jgi:hypothetical protein